MGGRGHDAGDGATFFVPGLANIGLMLVAMVLGTSLAWISGKQLAIAGMPQMVAPYNGLGGGSAAAIGAVELLRWSALGAAPATHGAGVGDAGRADRRGGVVGFDDRVDRARRADGPALRVPRATDVQCPVFVGALVAGALAMRTLGLSWIASFFALALAVGVLMTLPIGGADMPVVISLYNALTGLAVAFEGVVLGNDALIIAVTMAGAAGQWPGR